MDNISSKHIVERLRKIGDNYNGYNLDKIYIVSKFYESVSQKTYRDWETINTALEIHYNNILPGNGKSKAEKVKKAVKNDLQKSITEINELVSNYKLLKALNNLRNTIIHRGKRIMKYCELDDFFSQYVLPFVRDVLNCHYYRWHLNQLKSKGVYDSICKIIDEGKKATISYSKIAFQKELARCNLFVYKSNIQKGKEKEENN